jgi:S1-C subfamily serine protease
VVAGGPAANAGLKASTQRVTIDGQRYLIAGDIITSINGVKVINYDGLSTYLERHVKAGETISRHTPTRKSTNHCTSVGTIPAR